MTSQPQTVKEVIAETRLEAFSFTLLFSFVFACLCFGLNYVKWSSETSDLIKILEQQSINNFIIQCTKKPKDCEFLLKAIRNNVE